MKQNVFSNNGNTLKVLFNISDMMLAVVAQNQMKKINEVLNKNEWQIVVY